MKQFDFNLEKILKLRLFREREAEIELASAIGALTAVENRIRETANKRIEAASIRFLHGQSISQIYHIDLYIIRLDKLRDQLFEDAAKAELVVEEAREKFLEASRERKVIDKIKERRLREYRKIVNNEEIKMIDDISNGRTSRLALIEGA